MWTPSLWEQWSGAVESASNGAWKPEPGRSPGTLKLVDSDGDILCYAHMTFNGEQVITPFGTPTGNDAKTVLRGGEVLNSAARWVAGPGAVKTASVNEAHAQRVVIAANKAIVTERGQSLVMHLAGVGIPATLFPSSVTEHRSEVRVNLPTGGALTVRLYPDGAVYVNDASGSARSLEILAAAVDDWETRESARR